MRDITRREAVKAGAVGGLVIATTDTRAITSALAKAKPLTGPAHPQGTTLAHTLLRGPVVNGGGYRHLKVGAGERHIVRHDLGIAPKRGRRARRRAVVAFAHLTDIHVVDAQSPARVEYTDRVSDNGGAAGLFSAAYRPHEFLTAQVSDSIVAAINAVGVGPATGKKLAFAICTGDNVDNTQLNEVRWGIDVLDGRRVRPDSGDITRYEGVTDGTSANYDIHYWHPGGTPAGNTDGADLMRTTYGFPVVRGLLDAARRPFTPHGLNIPWLTAYGNHDGLVQGNFPKTSAFNAVATGKLKVNRVGPGLDPLKILADALKGTLGSDPLRAVTPDPNRRLLTRAQTIAEHFHTTGRPRGHGYTKKNLATGHAYYAFDHGIVRGLVLDTVNPNGEADGSIDEGQLAWLTAELRAHSSSFLDTAGHRMKHGAKDRVIVLFSHHTIATMGNGTAGPNAAGRRVLGTEVRDLLLRFPNVVLWVNGHTHDNVVFPHPRPAGSAVPGGFWELNTASHIDFPQQARLVEIADNRDGTMSIFGTIIDSAGGARWNGSLHSTTALASLARELAVNDPQERAAPPKSAALPDGRRGTEADRNVELIVRTPFALTPSGRKAEKKPRALAVA